MTCLVYFSSTSGNTHRFITKCLEQDQTFKALRVPLTSKDGHLIVEDDYILVTPTYGGLSRSAGGHVPKQVIRFLNDPENRNHIRGVIAAGNTNFGEEYAAAGDIISSKCHVPHLYRFELFGTPEDVSAVVEGSRNFLTQGTR